MFIYYNKSIESMGNRIVSNDSHRSINNCYVIFCAHTHTNLYLSLRSYLFLIYSVFDNYCDRIANLPYTADDVGREDMTLFIVE